MFKFVKILITTTLAITLLSSGIHTSAGEANSISAKSYVLMEAQTGRVIESKNSDQKLAIASTTKILTALIALEQSNITDYFEVDSNAIMVEGSSMGLKAGDKVSLEALAYGMLLPSGNDAANATAVKIAGSIPEFAPIMNKRAAQIGMTNSNFVTPSGLHDENHYSTAYDMALLGREAIKNDTFLNICKQSRAKLQFGNPPYQRYLVNHNKLLSLYDGCVGIKTGFTKKAGRCLVTAAQKDGITLICVTLNAGDDWSDHKKLYDSGFANIEKTSLTPKLENVKLKVVGGIKKTVKISELSQAQAPVTSDQAAKLEQRVNAHQFYYSPIKKGQVMGEVEYLLDGEVIATTTLIADESIEIDSTIRAKSFFEKIKDFFKGILK